MMRGLQHSKGPCIICGAPEHSCEGAPHTGVVFDGPLTSRFVSARQVTEDLPGRPGAQVVLYNAGDPVPVLEALRQGQVSAQDLNDAERESIKAHVARGQASVADVKAWLKPPRDKMLKVGSTVTK